MGVVDKHEREQHVSIFPEETQFLSCSDADEKDIKACVVCKITANTIFHPGSMVNRDSGRNLENRIDTE